MLDALGVCKRLQEADEHLALVQRGELLGARLLHLDDGLGVAVGVGNEGGPRLLVGRVQE